MNDIALPSNRRLYLDIETIPTQDPKTYAEIAGRISPPASMKKAETIKKWEEEQKPQAVADAIAKTSFDGAAGHICCIGWALDGEHLDSLSLGPDIALEHEMLTTFFEEISCQLPRYGTIQIVGHNVIGFDLRFIWQRCLILGVRVPGWFPRDPKPWSDDVFDTMTAFVGSRAKKDDSISMDRLCGAFGLEGKGDIDGSQVAGLWSDGEHETIAAYCRDDVEKTRALHRKMMVALGETEAA